MRNALLIIMLALAVNCPGAGAFAMPQVLVTNKSDSYITIVPLDKEHEGQLPSPLDQVSSELPPGSFLLINHRSAPINALVTLWSFVDNEGLSTEKRFNCDGYVALPSESIVKGNDSVLVTLDGCTMREFFLHMAAGGPMLGGNPLRSPRNRDILQKATKLNAVQITIDSAIFADGMIWGPDKRRYYTDIVARCSAIRTVGEEVSNAVSTGQPMAAILEKIGPQATEGSGGRESYLKRYYAGFLRRSPDPQATLKLYNEQAPLPEFRHVGEQK